MRSLLYFCTFMNYLLWNQLLSNLLCYDYRFVPYYMSTSVLLHACVRVAVTYALGVRAFLPASRAQLYFYLCLALFLFVPQCLLSVCCTQEQFSFTFVLYFVLACSCSYSVPAESLYSATLFPWQQDCRRCYPFSSGLRGGGQRYLWLLRPFQWGEFCLLGQSFVLVVFCSQYLYPALVFVVCLQQLLLVSSVLAFFLLCACVLVRFLFCLLMLVLHRSSLPIRCLRLTSVSLRFPMGDRSGTDAP